MHNYLVDVHIKKSHCPGKTNYFGTGTNEGHYFKFAHGDWFRVSRLELSMLKLLLSFYFCLLS